MAFKDDNLQDEEEMMEVRHQSGPTSRHQELRNSKSSAALMPNHRQQKRPVSILKKKNQMGRFVRNTNWNYYKSGNGSGGGANGNESSNSDNNTPNFPGYKEKTITETNFFECREITNCEFIYEQSDKNPNR